VGPFPLDGFFESFLILEVLKAKYSEYLSIRYPETQGSSIARGYKGTPELEVLCARDKMGVNNMLCN
jgi:hypothetical protein